MINGNIMLRTFRAANRKRQLCTLSIRATEPNCTTMDEIDFQSGPATHAAKIVSRMRKNTVRSGRIWTRSLMFPEIRYFREYGIRLMDSLPFLHNRYIFQWISPLVISTGRLIIKRDSRDFLNPYTIAFRPAPLCVTSLSLSLSLSLSVPCFSMVKVKYKED